MMKVFVRFAFKAAGIGQRSSDLPAIRQQGRRNL